jgi:ATP-dependent DNA helicase DinG
MPPLLPCDLGLDNARYPSFHKAQLDTIYKVSGSPKRFKMIQAPTGTGKSLINVATAILEGARTLFLVHNKSLQDQLSEFSSIGLCDIKGHSHYACGRARKNSHPIDESIWSCEKDAGLFTSHPQYSSCQYRPKVEWAKQCQLVSTNYAHWLSISRVDDGDRLGKFDLLICDEAHLCHNLLVDHMKVTLSLSDLRRHLGISTWPENVYSNDYWGTWISYSLSQLVLARKSARKINSKETQSALYALETDLLHLQSMLGSRLIFTDKKSSIDIIPVWGREFAETHLFRSIPNVLLCSATVNEADAMDLGIPPTNLEFIEVNSTFPPHRHPFIYSPCSPELYVDHRLTEYGLRSLISKIDNFVGPRKDRKGIVHSWSYKWQKKIVSESRFREFMVDHDSRSLPVALEKFVNALPPCTLVSPSVKEGYDFPFDLCRYQILPKVPFLDRRDPIIAQRCKDDSTYADRQTARTIEQMAGRGMRRRTDACESAIFDAYWKKLMKRREYFSKSFIKTWRWQEDVSKPIPIR